MSAPVRLLVFGGRDFKDREWLRHEMNSAVGWADDVVVIAGGAPGADRMAAAIAREHGVPVLEFFADWDDLSPPDAVIRTRPDGSRYNANAGPTRNQRMLDEGKPTLALMMPGHNGTADMLRRCEIANVHVIKARRT